MLLVDAISRRLFVRNGDSFDRDREFLTSLRVLSCYPHKGKHK